MKMIVFQLIAAFILAFLTGNNTVLSQGLLLNPNFKQVNICHEYKKPCCFQAWYCIGTISNPKRLKNRQLVQSYQTFNSFQDQYKNAMVGCINHAILPHSKLTLSLEFEVIEPMKVGIAFCDSFPVSDSYDVSGLDSALFQFYEISGSKKQQINIENSDTALFILILFMTPAINKSIYITRIDLHYIDKSFNYLPMINSDRIQFIFEDKADTGFQIHSIPEAV